eukprot:CAMPEP_0179149672 /NCGR_PEP_ID=MMETSP0796-20121207/72528_1 /TAXON_ID=73915 /ORGANISM="Pyrodinium bahamense, Strain pbaha01" /LENGTH=136 /DNA_ID=CAMNT_0020850545 /DNA_START=442 /DNA_END=853 /DNA_ORIENTATION=-
MRAEPWLRVELLILGLILPAEVIVDIWPRIGPGHPLHCSINLGNSWDKRQGPVSLRIPMNATEWSSWEAFALSTSGMQSAEDDQADDSQLKLDAAGDALRRPVRQHEATAHGDPLVEDPPEKAGNTMTHGGRSSAT